VRSLITGAGGQLGRDLAAALDPGSTVALGHDELDVTDEGAVERALEETGPEVVFNCAAFHNVDLCESEPDQAWATNVRAVRSLARGGARVVHISTNYVFDGRREEPYPEDHLPAPQSVYALTKLAGEHAALAYGDRPLVVRTAGLYGVHGSAAKGGNFVQRMVARAREEGSIRMVSDQRLQPTFTADLAAALVEAVEAGADGLVHLTSCGECTWHEFTDAIMEEAGIDVPIEPVETTVPPGGAARPLNGVLARPRADALGLTPLRPWREALTDYMAQAGLAAASA
jgi:dTDP-4-dehydrorhamnose reductase